MRSIFRATSCGTLLFAAFALLALRDPKPPAIQIRQQLLQQADSLLAAVRTLQRLTAHARTGKILQQQFRQVRLAYKKMEWAAAYFDPLTARQVNGPPAPEAELRGQVIQPDGLQVIESCLFPRFLPNQSAELQKLLSRLSVNAAEFKTYFTKADLQDWQILDAAKQEVFRIETLGLNDFDAPMLKNCFRESAAALQSTSRAIDRYEAVREFTPAIRYLQQPASFNHFDRAAFILRYANPLSAALTMLHNRLNLPVIRYNRLLNQDAPTLFAANAFNCNAYTAAPEDSVTTDKIALGKKLFFDPMLSGTGKRSCASCHRPEKAFTDGLAKNLDITGKRTIARNTPTLINAALQPAQFYDLRAPSLEDQARDVMQNKDEMHGDLRLAITRLWQNPAYRELFERAYPHRDRMAIDTSEVMNALAGYVRSLTALNSRFDNYMRGKLKALTCDEVSGFNLFMGKANCSTCHYLPLFNGALPPRYMQMEAEVIGIPEHRNGKNIDPDPGTYGVQPLGFNRHAFKITSVRNAARTAPYMHNGVFNTLAQVIDFYDRGGGTGNKINVPNQTLPAKPLHLTRKEKAQLIAFIKSLDSH